MVSDHTTTIPIGWQPSPPQPSREELLEMAKRLIEEAQRQPLIYLEPQWPQVPEPPYVPYEPVWVIDYGPTAIIC